MPRLSRRKECGYQGCHTSTDQGYCAHHKHLEPEPWLTSTTRHKPSGGDTRRYNTTAWRNLRRVILKRDPVCVDCRIRKASHVDHIIPHKRGGTDTLSNLQGLCVACHSRKTLRGD